MTYYFLQMIPIFSTKLLRYAQFWVAFNFFFFRLRGIIQNRNFRKITKKLWIYLKQNIRKHREFLFLTPARVLKPFLGSPRSKVPNLTSGRTLVKSTIWSHPGRKYRIEIFGHRVAKTVKKSWRETLRITGAKFQRKILSPDQHFRIVSILSEVSGWRWHSALCKVPPQHFGTLHQWCVKFLSAIFPFWGRKYRIRIFGC